MNEEPDVDLLIAELRNIQEKAPKGKDAHRRLYDAAQLLAVELEEPDDSIHRICFAIRTPHSPGVKNFVDHTAALAIVYG